MARRRQQQSSSTARVPDDVDEPNGDPMATTLSPNAA
jgi:hypothetical protein